MTNRSFVRYQAYAERHMLPFRRLELYLAQVAMMVVSAAGAQNITLSDFVFDPDEDEQVDGPSEAVEPEEAEAFFNFNPRNRA
jgi:hypothetical protein